MTANRLSLMLLMVTLFCALVFAAGYKIGWRDGWAEPYRIDGQAIVVHRDGTWEYDADQ